MWQEGYRKGQKYTRELHESLKLLHRLSSKGELKGLREGKEKLAEEVNLLKQKRKEGGGSRRKAILKD